MAAPKDPLITIVGATGTGKSKLAVDLALRFNGEIINGDAMQMYKGLPIITNKVTPEEAQGVPHHLLDFVSLAERPWNVSTFTTECLKIVTQIRERGKLPILVGGTHYYTQALLFKESLVKKVDGTGDEDGVGVGDEEAMGQPQQQSESKEEREARWPILAASGEELYAKLKEVDPVMAKRWHPKDTRKVRRSLEIWLETGRPASEIYEEQKAAKRAEMNGQQDGSMDEMGGSHLRFPTLMFWVRSQNDVLRNRLDVRVDQMVARGLVEEVEDMVNLAVEQVEAGIKIDQTSGIWASIGFKEVQPYVLAKRSDPPPSTAQEAKLKDKSIELTKIATQQYANRQERWIRNKFMDAMDEAGEAARVFPMDSTNADAASWEENVKQKSEAIAAAFLEGTALPDPKSTSAMAQELLTMVEEERRTKAENRVQEARECTICNKVLMTRGQWEDHLKSNRHKKALRTQEKALKASA